MSSRDTNESNYKSTINEIVKKTVEPANGLGITDKHSSKSRMEQVIEKLKHLLRKIAHSSE